MAGGVKVDRSTLHRNHRLHPARVGGRGAAATAGGRCGRVGSTAPVAKCSESHAHLQPKRACKPSLPPPPPPPVQEGRGEAGDGSWRPLRHGAPCGCAGIRLPPAALQEGPGRCTHYTHGDETLCKAASKESSTQPCTHPVDQRAAEGGERQLQPHRLLAAQQPPQLGGCSKVRQAANVRELEEASEELIRETGEGPKSCWPQVLRDLHIPGKAIDGRPHSQEGPRAAGGGQVEPGTSEVYSFGWPNDTNPNWIVQNQHRMDSAVTEIEHLHLLVPAGRQAAQHDRLGWADRTAGGLRVCRHWGCQWLEA